MRQVQRTQLETFSKSFRQKIADRNKKIIVPTQEKSMDIAEKKEQIKRDTTDRG